MSARNRIASMVVVTGALAIAVACNLALGIDSYRDCATTNCEASTFTDAGNDAPVCADTDIDPLNCGRCGHSCLGASCAGGLCTPTTLVQNATSLLASALAVDQANIYFLSGPHVEMCSLTGCNQTAMTLTNINTPTTTDSILAYSDRVYFTGWSYTDGGSTGSFYEIDPSQPGVQPNVIATAPNQAGALVLCPSGVCFLSHAADSSGDSIYRSGLLADNAQLIAPGPTLNDHLTADEFHVYVADSTTIYSAEIIQGTSLSVVTTRTQVTDLAVVNNNLYWLEVGKVNPALMTCPAADCSQANISGLVTPLPGSNAGPWRMALDDANIYWTDNGDPGTVYSCGLNGCSSPTAVAVNQPGPAAIVVDKERIYWINLLATTSTASIVWVAK